MSFSQPITQLIRRRRSVRHYDANPLSPQHLSPLRQFIADRPAPPFANQPRFVLIHADSADGQALRGLGTYGFIKGAPAYIVGILPLPFREMDHEDLAYTLEEIVLYATDLGLGTCWLGASFTRSRFAERAGLQPHEWIPAVTPVGYAAADMSRRERAIRYMVQAHRRKAWHELFFLENADTPLLPAVAEPYAEALEMVRLAPSGSNLQPWRIIKETDRPVFHFFIQRKRVMSENRLLKADIQRLDMGIALCHFHHTAGECGLSGKWRIEPPSDVRMPGGWEYCVSRHGTR